MSKEAPIIELPEVVIVANEKDDPKGQDVVEATKHEGEDALGAAAKNVQHAHLKTPVSQNESILDEESVEINEEDIRYRLHKESDETLQKIASQPTGGDPFNAAVSKVAAQLLAERKARSSGGGKPWYRFW